MTTKTADIPADARAEVDQLLRTHRTLALYGSVARGDAKPTSDVDVATIGERAVEQAHLGRIAVTGYEEAHLVELARAGSLFVLHLREEAIVLRDDEGAFDRVFRAWTPPDFERTRAGMRAAAAAVFGAANGATTNLDAVVAAAIFIVRSELYLSCLERGQPLFALDGVAELLGAAEEVRFVEEARARVLSPPVAVFRAREILRRRLGDPVDNPLRTLEALAVSARRAFPLASDLAVRMLVGGEPLHYATAPAAWST